MAGTKVPRDPNMSPEVRRFLDDLSRVQNIFNGLDAAAATELLNVFTSTLKGLVPASGGGTTTFLRADATFASPVLAGGVLQVLQNQYTTNADLTNAIPLDDSTPLVTEGDQVLSQAITPASASNNVRVQAIIHGAQSTNNTAMIAALFRGTTCIDAKNHTFPTSNFPAVLTFDVLDAPATTSATTYSVRVGPSSNTLRLNGSTATRLFGGAAKCTLTVSEIKG